MRRDKSLVEAEYQDTVWQIADLYIELGEYYVQRAIHMKKKFSFEDSKEKTEFWDSFNETSTLIGMKMQEAQIREDRLKRELTQFEPKKLHTCDTCGNEHF